MSTVFKNVGKGILYIFLFPLIIIAVAVYAVIGLGVFVFQFFKMIVLFFSGRNLNSDLEEDIAAKAILGEIKLEEEKEESPLSLYPSDSPVYGSGYSSPLFEEKKPEPVEEKEKEGEDNEY